MLIHAHLASLKKPPRVHRAACARQAALLAIGCLALGSAPAVPIQFIYGDADGTGFLDPLLGAERQRALSDAAAVWGRLILSSYADEVITVRASFADYAAGSTTLASAKPNYFYSEFTSQGAGKFGDTNYPKALANHMAHSNLSTRHDITINVNRATNFYFGSGTPGPMQFDFITVAAHEIGHGLGFFSSFREDGDYGIYGDGTAAPIMLPSMFATPYDHFLTFGAGGTQLLTMSDNSREFAMTSGNIFWNGASGIAGNGGALQMFAPAPWDGGSSIAHLNAGGSLMSPSIAAGQMRRTPSAAERGMLRDIGWTISVTASELTWSGAAGSSLGQAGNWAGGVAPLPGDSLVFGAAGASGSDIAVDLTLYSLGRIRFTADAPAYTLNFGSGTDTTFTGDGLLNESARVHTLRLATGSVMSFENAAGASNANFRLAGGDTSVVFTQVSYYFDRTAGARIAFNDTAGAASANFTVGGGSGNGGIKGQVLFRDTSNAADAVFVNEAGRAGQGEVYNGVPITQFGFGAETRFEDSASAGRARITNHGILFRFSASQGTGGYTTFADRSSAANAVIENLGGDGLAVGGVTEFVDDATAGQASFTNRSGRLTGAGRTAFFGRSSADRATFVNTASDGFAVGSGADPGLTVFREFSNAGSATITNQFGGRTAFHGDANAARATIRAVAWNESIGIVSFHDRASAADATIVATLGPAPAGSNYVVIQFNDNSTAGNATFRGDAGAMPFQMYFTGNSNAGSARFDGGTVGQNRIEFTGSSNAGSANFTVRNSGLVTFYDNTSAGNATMTIDGWLVAGRNASLGNARLTIAGSDGTSNRAETLKVEQNATIANATIVLLGGTAPNARGAEMAVRNTQRAIGERAGNATISALGGSNGGLGGSVELHTDLDAPGLRLVTEGNGRVHMNLLFVPGLLSTLRVGSIEGSGLYQIDGGGRSEFTTGYLNTSTTVSGVIAGTFGGRFGKVGSGTLSLDGVNTYLAPTSVDGGTLAVNGSIPGDVFVNSGATLAGTGSVGGNVTVNAGGTLAPGLSPGTLRIGSLNLVEGGVLELEFGSAQRDLLQVAGDAFIAGTLEFELWGGYLPRAGDVVVLLEVGGARQGTFGQVVFPDMAPGFQYQFAFDGDRLTMLALNDALPVPEPGSVWLLLCGGLLLLARRRRLPCGAHLGQTRTDAVLD